ncbi:MAG: cupin domain-containing protein [Candidatus Thermoplasmatota archaeon]|nr:cupin domain-containing protein [Candidatus Thermoplasmatota archaeon]
MADKIVEKLTSEGIDITFNREPKNVTEKLAHKTSFIDTGGLLPPNMLKDSGPTMKLLTSEATRIELSKRREPMPFWHRNMDFDEVIICISGEATWTTETGEFHLKPGTMIHIPRGVSHTVVAKKGTDYTAIEIKSAAKLDVNPDLRRD